MGYTDAELREAWADARPGAPDCSESGMRTRRGELCDDGFLIGVDTSLNERGRYCTVWAITSIGRRWLLENAPR